MINYHLVQNQVIIYFMYGYNVRNVATVNVGIGSNLGEIFCDFIKKQYLCSINIKAMQNPEIEIMAPVGCWESLAAAIEAGATSVYFGIEHLNMRSRSSANFTTQDLHTIVERCQAVGVKTYLTLNIVMYPEDLPLMREIVDHAKAANVSAIIASDIAALQYAYQSGVEVHLSTQLNIANTEALKFYAQYADVVVLARELNMTQVASIYRDIIEQDIRGPKGELIRIEMFCHGALCMAVSGKCYLSLNHFGASANRGACMQICRRGYVVKDKESNLELEVDNQYIMSPKDLKTIHFLNKMLDAGVRVLKIEGRARGAEYVKTVVECYKEAVNLWLNDKDKWATDAVETHIEDWNSRLARVFNRGFWDGYYQGQKLGEWTHKYGSRATRKKVFAGKCTNFFKNISVAEFYLEATAQIQEGDELLITGETTGAYEVVAHDMHDAKGNPQTVIEKGNYFAIKTDKVIRRGDRIFLLKIEDPDN
jgi:putative protease